MSNKDWAIETVDLCKSFGTFQALKNLNLEVAPNSVYGFLGPNGSGKTTTIRLLTGLSNPTSGQSLIMGCNSSNRSLQARRLIGYLPDVPAFHKYMSGLEYLIFCGELSGYTYDEAKKQAYIQLERTNLTDAAMRKTGGYSRGMKQRLGLAAAMVGNPQVLFLDEPVSALDPVGRAEVLSIIKQLKENKTIFLSTHILSDVERICDKVGIIHHGRMIVSKTVQELKNDHAQNRFILRFAKDPSALLPQIKAQVWCEEAAVNRNEEGQMMMVVKAKDVEAAQEALPQIAVQQNHTLLHYEIVEPSLEEIFIHLTEAK
jgi:ABC-2 type transport system ATP-binding protein